MAKRRRGHSRRKDPKPIRRTKRVKRVLEMIHAFDGLMSLRQIDHLEFSGKGGSWPREYMRKLFDNGLVDMPSDQYIHKVPVGETVYWLALEGAKLVAGLRGISLKDLFWRKIGRWSLIEHDLAVNDFRIAVMEACERIQELILYQWVPESEFLIETDTVEYTKPSGTKSTSQVRPDGFFTIRRPARSRPGKTEEFAFLLEIDLATEDNPRFARQKVRPGVAYLQSEAYKQRFGIDYGAFLVVTRGGVRMKNMITQTKRAGGEGVFYFTTFDQLSAETVLTEPIWRRVGRKRPVSLVL
jgi:hypothetical protein